MLKQKWKRISATLLIFVMVFALASCGGDDGGELALVVLVPKQGLLLGIGEEAALDEDGGAGDVIHDVNCIGNPLYSPLIFRL